MRAVRADRPGGPEALSVVEAEVPRPGDDEVLIRVAAAGVNRLDCLQRQGAYPPPPGVTDILGLEVAGEVVAAGPGVPETLVGERVTALVAGGGYAEYAVAPASSTLPVPAGLEVAEAAAMPETFFTVWHNVVQRGGLQAGETLLVHGGASGIGTTAIQLAKAFGAGVVVNYRQTDFVEAVRAFTDGRGADLILDMVGGAYVDRNYDAAAVDGRIVQIAFLQGAKAEANFSKLMMKRLTHTGSTLRPRDAAFKGAIARDLRQRVWPLVEAGDIRPVMDQRFPLADAAAAHRRMEAGDHIGKIVLVT